MSTSGRPRIVVLRALKLGDLLTAVPAIRALAEAFPRHELVLAAPSWLEPLARHALPVDRVVDTQPLTALHPVLHGAEVAVNLHGRGPESTALLAATRPARLIAFGVDGRTWREDEHEVARWCRLLTESGIPADPGDLLMGPPPTAVPAWACGATVIHPGAASPSRCWPVERWTEVAAAERAAGRTVLLTGTEAERSRCREVATGAALEDEAVLAGRTDLLELAGVIAAAGRVASADTGVAHLATALSTPSVVLFGPVPPSRWGPPPHPRHIALWHGRTGDPHGATVDPGLLAITADEVLAALDRLPTGGSRCRPYVPADAAPAG